MPDTAGPDRAGDPVRVPLDPDAEQSDGARPPQERPAHLRPHLLALVFVGGAIGTAARASVAVLVPEQAGVPLPTLAVNILGAFLLGVLLEALGRRGPDVGPRRALRLTLGTGVLGGFTTYSSLTAETGTLSLAGGGGIAAAYAVGSLLLGVLAAWAGIAVAGARR